MADRLGHPAPSAQTVGAMQPSMQAGTAWATRALTCQRGQPGISMRAYAGMQMAMINKLVQTVWPTMTKAILDLVLSGEVFSTIIKPLIQKQLWDKLGDSKKVSRAL